MSTKPTQKAAPGSKSDPKKVKLLVETFPKLSEEEAGILLKQYDGSIKLATEAALSGERWTKVTKKPKKEEKQEEVVESPVERRPPRERRDPANKDKAPVKKSDRAAPSGDAKPRYDKSAPAAAAAAVAEPAVAAPAVHQHAEISGTSWVKGKSISFADMLKKQPVKETKPTPAPVAAPAPEAPAAPQQPAIAAAAVQPTKSDKTEKNQPKAQELKETPAQAPAETPADKAVESAPKQRRERKPRAAPAAESTKPADAAPAIVEAPKATAVAVVPKAPVPVVEAPKAPVVVASPKPAVVKYVLEFDQVNEALSLPTHVEDIALRFQGAFVFNGTQGRAPTPPPVAPAVAPPAVPAASFANAFPPAARQSWPTAPAESRYNNNNQWNAPDTSSWGRTQPVNFTSYQGYPQQQQQQQFRPQTNYNSRYSHPHQHSGHGAAHHRGGNSHADHVASDLAYTAIREEPRFAAGGGVW